MDSNLLKKVCASDVMYTYCLDADNDDAIYIDIRLSVKKCHYLEVFILGIDIYIHTYIHIHRHVFIHI